MNLLTFLEPKIFFLDWDWFDLFQERDRHSEDSATGNFLSRDLNTAKGGGVEAESDEVVGIEDYGQVRPVIYLQWPPRIGVINVYRGSD